MDELNKLLHALPQLLAPTGRAVFIAFHSAEDRLIKLAFAQGARKTQHGNPMWQLLCRKPLRPQEQEVKSNPRARSARLRAIAMLDSN
ncbi:MAG: 16S rRNA (cytosine(1402)-N(4))-methyltransferase [Myxococcota bacterium]